MQPSAKERYGVNEMHHFFLLAGTWCARRWWMNGGTYGKKNYHTCKVVSKTLIKYERRRVCAGWRLRHPGSKVTKQKRGESREIERRINSYAKRERKKSSVSVERADDFDFDFSWHHQEPQRSHRDERTSRRLRRTRLTYRKSDNGEAKKRRIFESETQKRRSLVLWLVRLAPTEISADRKRKKEEKRRPHILRMERPHCSSH